MSPKLLPKSTIKRLPIRTNFDNRYFTDKHQGLPIEGYYKLFENMVNHKNIKIELDCDYFEVKNLISDRQLVIYTGPIDRYFNYKYGVLGWRTVDFQFETLATNDFQGNAVINYCDLDIPYTRIHEFFHLHPERTKLDGYTVIAKEFSRTASKFDEPYYPINSNLDRAMLLKYRSEIVGRNILFGGRLGTYQYLDMHMAIASALSLYETKVVDWFSND
jgi:UDP-galactopyranose mutase